NRPLHRLRGLWRFARRLSARLAHPPRQPIGRHGGHVAGIRHRSFDLDVGQKHSLDLVRDHRDYCDVCHRIPGQHDVCRNAKGNVMPELAAKNAARTTPLELSRDLGVSHATAIVVGTIIGSGIFLVPAEMMQAVGSARLVYLAWIVGGMLSLAGAITYAELGAMKPQAGGEYVYIRDAYGPLPAFLYGWTWFAIAKPASVATLTTGLVRILGTFPALAFLNHTLISTPLTVSFGQFVAIAAAGLITALNYIGIKRAGDFQVIFTLLKIGIIAAVAMLAFTA